MQLCTVGYEYPVCSRAAFFCVGWWGWYPSFREEKRKMAERMFGDFILSF